ncbi:alkene reductase [Devosia sp. 1566]|uniref:alkene reductase n=1 Tax=Devosia sp. 1566 TaxID=2499144 RepID=UPI0020BD82CE|nr:alkene reductase [Devosia sp. 1566]
MRIEVRRGPPGPRQHRLLPRLSQSDFFTGHAIVADGGNAMLDLNQGLQTMTSLFTPYDFNGLHLPNRIVMAPMTRTRAMENGVPSELMIDYYVQRASAGLNITECTQVSDQAHGIIRAPGIHRDDQIAGWRKVTDAVHAAGGRIYNQIWHAGRVSHPEIRGGELPVGPSPVAASGNFFLPRGRVDFPQPRELHAAELPAIIEDFAQATRNAREAGFDGVELHGANGYLQDQFLQDGSNHRTDSWGASIAGRARLLLETAEAMIAAWSAERVGVRLSPSSVLYGMHDSNKRETFSYAVRELDRLGVGYLHLTEPNEAAYDTGPVEIGNVAETFRPVFRGTLVVNGGFDRAKGDAVLSAGHADLVAFGVPFLANPDLVERLRVGAPFNTSDPTTFFGEGARGYTDYPLLELAN